MIIEWPIGLAAILMQAGLRGGDDEHAVLDRARPQQDFPMRLAGLAGEGGGHRHDLGPGRRLRPEEFGKAHVVADGAAELAERQVHQPRRAARRIGRAFPPAFAIVEIDVEHVDLVVVA